MFSSGILVIAACVPCMVWADSVAVATAVASASNGPDCVFDCNCNLIYDPVCGTDGITYSNKCVLGCFNAENERNGRPIIKIFSEGECETVKCYCPSIYEPICATNNQTYTNECYLNCENSVRINNGLDPFEVSYDAECQIPFCICPNLVIPVCGTDGRTYRNICMLQCYSRINQAKRQPAICVKDVGACEKETCYSSKPKDELCASDDRTYYNDCVLSCENRRRDQLRQELLTVKYRGKCVYCQACTADYNPVCASNDVTFSNYCHFECENAKRKAACKPLLRKRWYGECDCRCTKEWYPVCASNNQTFQNRCALNCLNRKRKQDGLLEYGIQFDGICYNCECRRCGDRRLPVCGTDKVTYLNQCWLECISDCRVRAGHSGICKKHDGECKV